MPIVIRMLPEPLLKAALTNGPGWRALGRRCRARAFTLCPSASHQGYYRRATWNRPHLKNTLELRFSVGEDPRIEVGSRLVVDGGYSLLDIVEEGTDAHGIDPVEAKALRFSSGSNIVFAAHVNHPGTKSNRFVEKAMQQVVQEAGGIADVV